MKPLQPVAPQQQQASRMVQIAIQLRALQLSIHHAHLFCSRVVFFQDHEFFGDLYGFAEGSFDSVIERLIGLGRENEVNIASIMDQVSTLVKQAPVHVKENKEYYNYALKGLSTIKSQIEQECKSGSISQGTLQMLGDIADKIEVYEYKIKQRIKA